MVKKEEKKKLPLRDRYYNFNSRWARRVGILSFFGAILLLIIGIGFLFTEKSRAVNCFGGAVLLFFIAAYYYWVSPRYYQYLRQKGTLVERTRIVKKNWFLFKKFK